MRTDDWRGCYRGGWGRNLVPEAFAHPAKVAFGLSERIFAHMREESWIIPGSVILDPFAGIGGFALNALIMGCRFIGIELERPFVDMASGCECTGVNKADWVRFYGRLDRVRYNGERYICPQCVSEMKGILSEATAQVPLFEYAKDSASYRRNSGMIPETKAHHYTGNLDVWANMGLPGSAVILQGDSRNLLTWQFAGTKVDGCVGSPPFSDTIPHQDGTFAIRKDGSKIAGAGLRYGSSPSNLGNMPEGDVDAVISSPPYAAISPEKNSGSVDRTKQYKTCRAAGGGASYEAFLATQAKHSQDYGSSPGQLGQMREGEVEACVSSPPWEQSGTADHKGQTDALKGGKFRGGGDGFLDHYEYALSQHPNQLANKSGDTFWSASKSILEQVFLAVRPGGHAVFVLKAFVRKGKPVDFPGQWRQLCESVGFRCLHVHRAWLVEDNGTQQRTDGGETRLTKERKSFFRRLAEKKGSPRIDWECVQCFARP